MQHPEHQVRLLDRLGQNTVRRSMRQRRKMYEAEVRRVCARVSRITGEPVHMDMPESVLDERAARDPVFAAAVEAMYQRRLALLGR